MSDPLLSAIEELQAKITLKEQEKELEILPLKLAVNQLCKVMDKELLYDLDGGGVSSSPVTKAPWKVDHFFNRPLATCVLEILTWQKESGLDGPASVDQIYDHMIKGGFKFEGTGDADNQKRALKISLTKNTAMFVKIGDSVFGLRTWYKMRAPRKNGKSGDATAEDQTTDLLAEPVVQEREGVPKEDAKV